MDEAARPIAIDLCCGLGGWTAGLLAEGYRVIGFDLVRPRSFPSGALFVQQDVATIDGTRWRSRVALIVASPPCTEFSDVWHFARSRTPDPEAGMVIVRECFRIAHEAGAPFVVENVRGARKYFAPEYGPPTWHVGPYWFWGAKPVLTPQGPFYKGCWNTRRHPAARGGRWVTRARGDFRRDPAKRSVIPLPIARAVAAQAREGALWTSTAS